jgi:tetratricopeptide (TPR) repeat protein
LLKIILLTLISINIFALEISLQGAKEKHQAYSTLHIKNKDRFLCQDVKNDFDVVIKIVCAFSNAPSKEFKNTQNNFFKIKTELKNKTFFLIIEPYAKMKLYPIIFDLSKEETIFSPNVKLSKHWMIIGYKQKIPYIKSKVDSDLTINFPFTLNKDNHPYIGSLDIDGKPVHIKRAEDISEYIKIKKLYKEKKYELCLDIINDVIINYPNSIFKTELLFYKVKVYSKLKKYDELIDVAKIYLNEYSSDENIAEMLSLISRAYFKSGFNADADYFFDRLFSEHADSPYVYKGYLYKGEMLEESASFSAAKLMYKKVINETKDIDTAIEAAYKLAYNYMGSSNYKESAKYVKKIIDVKPKYFAKKLEESMDLMYGFVDNGDYISGAYIANAIVSGIKRYDDYYEELLKNIGVWFSKTDKKQEALVALNRYLKEFEDGIFEEEVSIAKDSLFFEVSDANLTTKLYNYDKLIDEYNGDSIGDRAIYEKAKLLIENEKFEEALDVEDKLLTLNSEEYTNISNMITQSAIGTMKNSLKKEECNSVLLISSKYKIELSNEWDSGIYKCAMKGADFTLAKKMADKNLKSKNLNERKKWLYRYIKIDFATGNYSNVIEASKELITLIQDDKNSIYLDVYRYIFDTYHRLENFNKMIEAIINIEKVYKQSYEDIDRYVAVMSVGSDKKDSNLVVEYGEKVLDIQVLSDSYPQSPFIEFTLYQAYIDKTNHNKALDVIKSLNSLDISKNSRARQKYLLGNIYEKLWRDDDAKNAYQEAIDADKESAWAELAKSAKGI